MLKQLMLSKKLEGLRSKMAALVAASGDIETRKAAMKQREAELEEAVNELTENSTEEERTTVDEAAAQFEADQAALDKEAAQNAADQATLGEQITATEAELEELEKKARSAQIPPAAPATTPTQRKDDPIMKRTFFGMTMEQRDALLQRDDVKQFLQRVRSFKGQNRAVSNGDLLIPEILLPILREVSIEASKLMKHVHQIHLPGKARQNVMGSYPDAVWTEMYGALNELNFIFNSNVELDGYKVGGFVAVPNALLEDADDVALASEIISGIGKGIARAVDKAILYGTGVKMPRGIVTRLVEESDPISATRKSTDRGWKDLHTSNVITIAADQTGINLFKKLVEATAACKHDYTTGGRFWAMNENTRTALLIEAMSLNAPGAIVSGMENTLPLIGGTIEEITWLPDNVIIGGYGDMYILGERAGTSLATSEHYKFVEDQTVFRGTARYDGCPVIPESFVAIGIKGTSISASAVTFTEDEANTVHAIVMNTSTASVVVGSKVKLNAILSPAGVDGTITWASSATAKATVNNKGEVTGVAAGDAIITATCNGFTCSCAVTVTAS